MESKPCVFVTGIPRTGGCHLAGVIASNLCLPLVQMGRNEAYQKELETWNPILPSGFEHAEAVTRKKVAILKILEQDESLVIEGVAPMVVAEDLLHRNHVIVIIQPPDWETYEHDNLAMRHRAQANEEAIFEFEYSCFSTALDKALYTRYRPAAEHVIELGHPRVVVYKYGEWIKGRRDKLHKIADLLNAQLVPVGGGIVADE